jgi:hypothetical protein
MPYGSSKSCGSCGAPAPASAKIGDRCSHCGVRWTDERNRADERRRAAERSESLQTLFEGRERRRKARNETKEKINRS